MSVIEIAGEIAKSYENLSLLAVRKLEVIAGELKVLAGEVRQILEEVALISG